MSGCRLICNIIKYIKVSKFNIANRRRTVAYTRLEYDLGRVTEYEYHFKGNYGAPGEKRGKRKKATPAQIEKQNQWNKETLVRRLILLNFDEDDLWTCLKYKEGTKLSVETVKKHWKEFRNKMSRAYKKAGEPFKFICRMEVSKSGGVHIHVLVNRLRGDVQTDKLMSQYWKEITAKGLGKAGHINVTPMYEEGSYEALAEYLTKKPRKEEYEQLSLFPEEERKDLIKYSTSRNLKRPVPKKKEYRRWTVRRLIENGPKPRPGYYIDKNSIISGVNRYTGMSYYRYREIKINTLQKEKRRE